MHRKTRHGQLKKMGKTDAKYIEQSDTLCPSCNSSTSLMSNATNKGFVKTCNSINCGWHQILYGAESFEARSDKFQEMDWTFEDLEDNRKGPSVLRPERTYNRADEDIENMIDRVMERIYYFRKMYYVAKKERNRKAMYLAIRNFKALEGVNHGLRWALGEKGVDHPLY